MHKSSDYPEYIQNAVGDGEPAVIFWDYNGTILDDVGVCVSVINTMLNRRNLPAISYDKYSMELMAEALGLGTVYVGLFTRPANQNAALRQSLGVTQNENIAICLAVGYPAVTYQRSAPKKPANVVWR